jgi:hypothetical protein
VDLYHKFKNDFSEEARKLPTLGDGGLEFYTLGIIQSAFS